MSLHYKKTILFFRCLKCLKSLIFLCFFIAQITDGSDFITIVDDDGTEFELEVLDTMDYKGQTFVAFLPADMDEQDPDYGIVILRSVLDENGDELFESIDDEDELQDVYEHFSLILFDDEDE